MGFLSIMIAMPIIGRRELTRDSIRRVVGPGTLLGGLIFVAYVLQTAGLERTTATNAGFITGLYVVFTPVLALAIFRQRAGRSAWTAVAISIIGLALLSTTTGAFHPRAGDLLVLASAVAWAGHLIGVGYFAARHPTRLLSLAQMAATASFHLVATAGEGMHPADALGVWHVLVVTGILGSGVAYTLQVMAQREITATRAALILAGESVASAAFSALWLGERLTATQWMGASLIVGAIVISELGARRRPELRMESGT